MQQALHILFLCTWYPSRVSPSNGDFVQRHARAVSRLHKVSVIHIISDKNCTRNIETDFQEDGDIQTHIAYVRFSKSRLVKAWLFYKAFKILLQKTGKFDVVHLNILYPFGIFALYLKYFKRKPFIATEHWSGYLPINSDKLSKWRLKAVRCIGKNAQFICPVSQNLQDSMENLGIAGNYAVVHNVVNAQVFKPATNKEAVFTIVHISDMSENPKNVPGILRAVANFQKQVSDFRLKLIGGNPFVYEPLMEDLKISRKNVQLYRQIPHEEVVRHLQTANVFVLFSNYENQPCVIPEAFACGLPVISTDVGGISEMFPKEFGYLIPAKDEQSLTEKLLAVFHQGQRSSETMHAYAREHFSPDIIARKYDVLYRESIAQKLRR